jgi:diguanylate cyclase (GGDEF)-like protein
MSSQDAVSGPELAALSAQAGDSHLLISADGICLASTDPTIALGRTLRDLLSPDDAGRVDELLVAQAAGPMWMRLQTTDDGARWVSAVSVPHDGGWTVQVREARRLDPTAHGPKEARTSQSVESDRESVLNEVAWLLSATPRTGKEIAVASCDLDDFAFINDEHGRAAGDEVLAIVTGRISDALRSGDLVARLEDDQLLVVLRGVHHLRGAIRVANKIRAAVEDPIPMPFGDIVQTVSIGVTLISRGESVDSVLERAEGAMAMAKDAGRNTVISSPPI